MRRFRFRLAGLLRLRSQFERQARIALASAIGDLARVEQAIASADAGLRECEDQGRGAAAHARLALALGEGLRRHALRLQREQRAAAARLDQARTDWLERRNERDVLQRLRERRREQWSDEALRRGQAELEELARALRAGEQRGEEGGP
jgi:flagellar export protein FliJ